MGHFKVKNRVKLADLPADAQIPESDFASILPDGTFVQLEYIEASEKKQPYKVKPGIWSMQKTMAGLRLDPTSFVEDKILDDFIHTKNITDKITCFFSRLHIYKKHGIEVPKRAMLLYGPPGTGKTSSSIKACKMFAADNKTAVLVWPTDKIDPIDVKDFFKSFDYIDGVEKVILVMEDIGGVEIDQVRIKSTASLLSLLDNQEKTFRIPIFILATTNHAENFLGSLTNRPGRFDDKIEVGFPDGKTRRRLLEFFLGDVKDFEVLDAIESRKYEEFSPAHIKELVIRADLYDISFTESLGQMQKEMELYKRAFVKNKTKLGIITPDEDY